MDIKIPSGPPGTQSIDEVTQAEETQPGTAASKTSRSQGDKDVSGIDAIARDVSAGRISANEAVDRILSQTLDHRSVREAPKEVRQELHKALEALVQSDPRLKRLAQALGVLDDD